MKIVVIGGTGLIGSKLVSGSSAARPGSVGGIPGLRGKHADGRRAGGSAGRGSGRRRPRKLAFVRRRGRHEFLRDGGLGICLPPKPLLA